MLKDQCEKKDQTISRLESIVEKSRGIYDRLKKRIEKLESQISVQKVNPESVDQGVMQTEIASNAGSHLENFGLATMRGGNFGMETMRSSNIKENGSLLGHPMVIGSHLHIMNIKSRFKKPITSKTINRMFTAR